SFAPPAPATPAARKADRAAAPAKTKAAPAPRPSRPAPFLLQTSGSPAPAPAPALAHHAPIHAVSRRAVRAAPKAATPAAPPALVTSQFPTDPASPEFPRHLKALAPATHPAASPPIPAVEWQCQKIRAPPKSPPQYSRQSQYSVRRRRSPRAPSKRAQFL